MNVILQVQARLQEAYELLEEFANQSYSAEHVLKSMPPTQLTVVNTPELDIEGECHAAMHCVERHIDTLIKAAKSANYISFDTQRVIEDIRWSSLSYELTRRT